MGFAYGTLIRAGVPGGPIQSASQRGVAQPPKWIRKEFGFRLAFLSNVKGNPLLSPQLCFLTSCFLCPLRVLRPSCGNSRTPAAPQAPAKVSSHFCPLPPPLCFCHGNELPLSSFACFLTASPRIEILHKKGRILPSVLWPLGVLFPSTYSRLCLQRGTSLRKTELSSGSGVGGSRVGKDKRLFN